ncbi:metallophosphoesterase [Rhodoferax antarcticus]|uniref:Putative serine/threonine phosphatase n=1 Tax=Rhodoferax antarcticus ANT.BR TaxID=1111071 RepID=A0A1Q8Y9D8_9BURK|nr:metallophosphoesterase [Rhodoferax antarcticus]OLP04662.1 putative serine/threonine phosphatase [Rhodoferax antarcticus ANT.BR]
MSNINFKRFKNNNLGVDYVVGDIHGAYDSVLERMEQVKFNKKTDRLFSLGDLIDRGPQSARVLAFLKKPYVHAVLGNHDANFIWLSVPEIRALGQVNWNGMGWVSGESDETLLEIQEAFKKLPIAIEVETVRGTVGLVHAGVPNGLEWNEFLMLLSVGNEQIINEALWGRDRVDKGDESGVIGIDRLFVGHSIQWNGPRRLGNVYYIDSGAIFQELGSDRGCLNVANLVCQSGILTIPTLPLGVYCDVGHGPFGDYATPVFANTQTGQEVSEL